VVDPAVGPDLSIGRVVADVAVRRHRRVDPRRQVDDVADPVEELGVQGEPARVLRLEHAVQNIGQGARHRSPSGEQLDHRRRGTEQIERPPLGPHGAQRRGRRRRSPFLHVIDLPLWSTLTWESDALRPSINDDRRPRTPPLTSAAADGSAELITRLPASGL